MFHFIWFVLTGFCVGWLARAVMPGPQPMGFIETTVVGILGSLLGGFIGNQLRPGAAGARFNGAGFLMSILGAVICLFLLRRFG